MNSTEEPLAEEISPEQRARRRRKLLAVALVFLLLLLAFFLPPLINLGRYRRSIAAGIAAALGRPVSVGSVGLRLLPTPGITLTDFTVEEDPAFGYEPALHANSVVVSLRLSSLWRRRLEIGTISLDEASLNLVRNGAGQWSIGSILLRASQIPNAPTAQRRPGPTPRFPYIEATDSRIDFKSGVEKKPFSLMNADFAMWQAGGGEWRLRLKAQPVRTDLALQLSDSGELRVEGSLRRAASLDAMPVDLSAEWSAAQLGQVSRLLAGADSGWRGDLDLTAQMRGTLADLALTSHIVVDNLRRQEFQPNSPLDVDAACSAHYLHAQHALHTITCFLPVAPGHLLLTGSVQGYSPANVNLRLELNHIPAAFPLSLLSVVRPGAQNDSAAGDINGSFQWQGAQPRVLLGDATASHVTVSWPGGSLPLPTLHFIAGEPAPRHGTRRQPPPPNAVVLQAASLPFGEPQPLTLDARLARAGFTLHVAGAASVARLTAPGATFGLLGPALAAVAPKGRADLNATLTGNWLPSLTPAPPVTAAGTLHLDNAELHPAFLHAPVMVDSADITLAPGEIAWQNADLRFDGMALHGSIRFPALCNQPTPCPAAFTLQAPALSGAAIEASLAGARKPGFFGQIFQDALGGRQLTAWPPLHGTLQAATLDLDRLALKNATATLSVDAAGLTIQSLDASALGGTLHAAGSMAVENNIPIWNLDIRLTGAQPAAAAPLFHERWGAGAFNGEAKLSMTGMRTADLASTATGSFQFTWQNGALGSAVQPLSHFSLWTASGSIAHETLTLATGSLRHAGQAIPVSGSIGFDRQLDLTLNARSGPTHIGGTLAHPAAH